MMKLRLGFILLILFLLISMTKIYSKDFGIGFGFTLEYPREIQYERNQGSINIQKVYIPITILNKIRIIPEIAYWDAEIDLDNESYKYSVLHIGTGLYYQVHLKSTDIYFGPRIAIVDIKNPSTNRPPNIITSKTDNTYGVTFGVENKIIKYFSIGFEVQYNYYEINPWTDFGYEEMTIERAIETVFVFAFHL